MLLVDRLEHVAAHVHSQPPAPSNWRRISLRRLPCESRRLGEEAPLPRAAVVVEPLRPAGETLVAREFGGQIEVEANRLLLAGVARVAEETVRIDPVGSETQRQHAGDERI